MLTGVEISSIILQEMCEMKINRKSKISAGDYKRNIAKNTW
jgi:hypothetical protein